jgi:chemotaxis protein CheX
MSTLQTMNLAEAKQKYELSPEHLESLKEAVVTTFGAISGADAIYEGEDNSAPCEGAVGIISVVGGVAWSLVLGFPRDTAVALSMKFAGFEIPYDSADMGDVVGELANVLAGDVVARLDVMGVKVDMSLPTVARGTDVNLMLPGALSSLRLRFSIPEGCFWLGLAIGRPSQR